MKKTDVLHRGDILLILPVNGIKYTVKSGDTINSISKKYKLQPEEIASFLDYNNLNSDSPLTVSECVDSFLVLILPILQRPLLQKQASQKQQQVLQM
jgi:hypothetical protein